MSDEHIQGLVETLNAQHKIFQENKASCSAEVNLATVRQMRVLCYHIYASAAVVTISGVAKNLFVCAAEYGCTETLEFFLTNEKSIKFDSDCVFDALKRAISHGYRQGVEQLVSALKRPYMDSAKTAKILDDTLVFAVECQHLELSQWLIAQLQPSVTALETAHLMLRKQQEKYEQLEGCFRNQIVNTTKMMQPTIGLFFSQQDNRKESEQSARVGTSGVTTPSLSDCDECDSDTSETYTGAPGM